MAASAAPAQLEKSLVTPTSGHPALPAPRQDIAQVGKCLPERLAANSDVCQAFLSNKRASLLERQNVCNCEVGETCTEPVARK